MEIIALELELQTHKEDTNDFILNADFFNKEEFRQFLEMRIYDDSVSYMRPHQFFTMKEAQSLFRQPNGDFLIGQLQNPVLSLEEIIPQEYKKRLVDLQKLQKEIGSDGAKSIQYYIIRHIYLSYPVFSKDQKYAMIWYAQ